MERSVVEDFLVANFTAFHDSQYALQQGALRRNQLGQWRMQHTGRSVDCDATRPAMRSHRSATFTPRRPTSASGRRSGRRRWVVLATRT